MRIKKAPCEDILFNEREMTITSSSGVFHPDFCVREANILLVESKNMLCEVKMLRSRKLESEMDSADSWSWSRMW